MQSIDSAQVSDHSGILGDYRGALPGRQITILSELSWDRACREIGVELPWTTRRANLLVENVEFDESWIGKKIRISDVELIVTRETTPCSRMDAQQQGLTAALRGEWRGGICCEVIKPGNIKPGDQLELL